MRTCVPTPLFATHRGLLGDLARFTLGQPGYGAGIECETTAFHETLEFSHRGETVQVNIESPGDLEVVEQRIEECETTLTRVGIKLRNPLRLGSMIMRFAHEAALPL